MASAYLTKSISTTGSQTKGTLSVWLKKSDNTNEQAVLNHFTDSNNFIRLRFNASTMVINATAKVSGTNYYITTNAVFRDTAWYHIVWKIDTTQATDTDRYKLYVNGNLQTFSASSFPTQNLNLTMNTSGQTIKIGASEATETSFFDGCMTHYHWTDGYAYDASTFGESDSVSGIWKPKTAPSVTYGTNGFFLKMENSGAMGTDSSGNTNTFTVSGNLTQNVDTPSNNFCTNNVLSPVASGLTIANGNLSITSNSGNGWRDLFGTLGVASGKWYWEQKIDNFSSGLNPHYIGVCDVELVKQASNATAFEDSSISRAYAYTKTGQILSAGTYSSYGDSWTTGDIVGIAVDLDNGKIYFSKNGVFQNSGNPTSGATGTGSAFDVTTGYTYVPLTATYYADNRYSYNFGQGYFGTTSVASAGTSPSGGGIFEYDCPSGYQALCTKGINSF